MIFQHISVSFSQSNQDFAPIGAEWYYHNSTYPPHIIFYRKYTYLKDTTINTISCGVIERYRKDGLNTDTLVQQFIYVSDNKIYEYENDTLYLLYDFNKTIGEYWIMPKYNDTIYIQDKYNIELLNGDSCSCFVVQNTNMYWKHSLITDCFGDINGLFPAPNTVGYGYGELRCYYEDNTLLYLHGDLPCDYSNVSINETLDNQNQFLFLNPVYDDLELKFTSDDINETSYIQIYNAFGQKILSVKIHSQETISIPFSSYTKGFYFMKVMNKNKNNRIYKIIKL
jgi:hypothetical protein